MMNEIKENSGEKHKNKEKKNSNTGLVGISRFRDLLQANQCKNWAAG
jgi:hypothetical protein